MSEVMMVDVPDACPENIHRVVIQIIGSFQRQIRDRNDLDVMGNALLVDHRLAHHLMDPEDMGRFLLEGVPECGVTFFGHFMSVPIFATGSAIRRTNGIIGWNTDRVGGIESAIRHFYSRLRDLMPGGLVVNMASYREAESFVAGFVPARMKRNYIDMEDVTRVMEL